MQVQCVRVHNKLTLFEFFRRFFKTKKYLGISDFWFEPLVVECTSELFPNSIALIENMINDLGCHNQWKRIQNNQWDFRMETALKDRERVGVEDFVLLENYQSIDAFADNLRKRFEQNLIYTYIGNVIISVNPYKPLSIYTIQQISYYRQAGFLGTSPHIFAVADTAYRSLSEENRGQCILISGESGSGKTEASKKVLQFIAAATGHHERVECVKDKLLQSNPVLEAFGNAKTNKNDNSSRFGKYMDVAFNFTGDPIGGNILNYLLEKSRVVYQNKGERNFHIFYQLLAGADDETLEKLFLKPEVESYGYLKHSKETVKEKTFDKDQYHTIRAALDVIELPDQEQEDIFKIVAGILHLGNVTFLEENDSAVIADMEPVTYVSKLLGCNPKNLEKALIKRTIEAADDVVVTPLNKDLAMHVRDALAKAIYDKLFTWLVHRINSSIQPQEDYRKKTVMGILDIYGFEVFERNSFEQFCINYCNEKLQQLFIQLTLKEEQDEYLREGIEWIYVDFFNNKIICDLIEEKHVGIIGILNEEYLRPGNTNDLSFLDKMNDSLAYHKHYISHQKSDTKTQKIMERDDFRLVHYAGEVTYNVRGFMEKNNDLLFRDLREVIIQTSNSISKTFFTLKEVNTKKRPDTTINQFKHSLNDLMEILVNKEPSYIRCIKPNDFKKRELFDVDLVKHQVKYLGLMENLRVRRAGFAYRKPYEEFLKRYKCLSKRTWPNYRGPAKEGVAALIQDLGYERDCYEMGKTKIFIRTPITLFKTEDAFQAKKHEIAAIIQKTWKGRKQKLQYQKIRNAVIQIQTIARGFIARKKAERRKRAVATIRRFIEGFITRNGPPTNINRAFVETAKSKWLIKLSKELPLSVLDKSWPPCPHVCKEASEIIRKMYMKQLALKYRRNMSPERKKKFEEKVLAEFLFKGKKKSYLQSVPQFFERDRLKAEQKKLMSAFQTNHLMSEKFLYSTAVTKYDRHGYKPRERALIISESNVFLLDGKTFKVKHKISHKSIIEILVTKEADNFMLVRIAPELKHHKGDLLLHVPHLIEAVTLFVDFTQKPKSLNIVSTGEITHNIIDGKPGIIKVHTGSAGSIPEICKNKTGELIIVG